MQQPKRREDKYKCVYGLAMYMKMWPNQLDTYEQVINQGHKPDIDSDCTIDMAVLNPTFVLVS